MGEFWREGVLGYAARLSFPRLFLFTLFLFVIDVLVPDPLPLVDEIILALVVLMLGSVRKRVRDQLHAPAGPPQLSPDAAAPATAALDSTSAK